MSTPARRRTATTRLARLSTLALVAMSATVGTVLGTSAVANADSADPTSAVGTYTVNADGTITVTASGTWRWERSSGNDCNLERYGTGWAIDWNDPDQPGNDVDELDGVMIDVGVKTANVLNPADNAVRYYTTAGCGTWDGTGNTGTWGAADGKTESAPITHTYAAGTTEVNMCVVTYDIHFASGSTTLPKPEKLIAGGRGHNGDNSVETNYGSVPVKCLEIDLPTTLVLNKEIVNDNGGTAKIEDFTLEATEGDTTLDGVDLAEDSAVGVQLEVLSDTEYTLSESGPAGYEATWSCNGGTFDSTDNTISLTDGQIVICTVTNDDQLPDLSITKSDGDAAPVAGGDAWTYTLSVDNLGPADVPAEDDVVVTDELPDGLEYVADSIPTECSTSGQTLTCTLDAADFEVSDEAYEITFDVTAPAGADSGEYTNLSYVDTPLDPAPDTPSCVEEEPLPVAYDPSANNVSCVVTDVDRDSAVSITKVDDFDETDSDLHPLHPGDSYSYALTVENTGTSTLREVTVTDDLPAGLSLDDVYGTGWTCNDVDPIECTLDEELDPGDTADDITVEVTIDEDYADDTIDNTAEVEGVVDTEETVTDDSTESTPVVPLADVSILKSASVASVVQGNAFTFTFDVANAGPSTAETVEVTDLMPVAFEIQSVDGGDLFDCSYSGQEITCTVDAMDSGDSGVITVAVKAGLTAATITHTNTAEVTTATHEDDLDDNADDASVKVDAAASNPPPIPETGGDDTLGLLFGSVVSVAAGAVALFAARRRRTPLGV